MHTTVVPCTDTSHAHRIGLDPSPPPLWDLGAVTPRHGSNYVTVHSYTIQEPGIALLPGPGDPYSTKTEGDTLNLSGMPPPHIHTSFTHINQIISTEDQIK